MLALYYGLRRSEIFGLKWDAFDFENETFEIKHTVVKVKTIVAKDKTKNKSSHRKYKMLKEIKEMFLELKLKQTEYKKDFGIQYFDSGYIFTWQDSRTIRPDYVTHAFHKVLKAHYLEDMRFHDLRHSCASMLYDLGWQAKDIQEWMDGSLGYSNHNGYLHSCGTKQERNQS